MAGTAFVDVTVVPMDEERLVESQTVLVKGGRIVSVGPMTSTNVPDDAERIDGRGRYLLPGLADMHVHYAEPSYAALFLANGVTTVRNMAGTPLHLAARDRIARGEESGPTMWTCGPIMDGPRPAWPGSVVIETREDAERAVAEQREQGYDFLKVYSNLSREAYNAIIAAADEHDMPVAGHVPTQVGVQHVLDSGQASIEHVQGYLLALTDDEPAGLTYFERMMHAVERGDESRIPELAARTAASGAWNCVTLVVHRRMGRGRVAYEEERLRPELRYLSPACETQWKDQLGRSGDPDRTRWAVGRAEELRAKIVRALHDAGAPLLLGSDTPNPFVIPGFSIHEELALLVAAGLSPYEALRTGTHDAAVFLGVADEFGTVAVGLRADLILVEGNPLTDVATVAGPAGVMSRGHWFPAVRLRSMLVEVAAKAADQASGPT